LGNIKTSVLAAVRKKLTTWLVFLFLRRVCSGFVHGAWTRRTCVYLQIILCAPDYGECHKAKALGCLTHRL
ncbi:MAG: hypothetical protein ACSLE0_11150, partial [Chitinophagaceae bacterium]